MLIRNPTGYGSLTRSSQLPRIHADVPITCAIDSAADTPIMKSTVAAVLIVAAVVIATATTTTAATATSNNLYIMISVVFRLLIKR